MVLPLLALLIAAPAAASWTVLAPGLDLDEPGVSLDAIRREYGSVVQNLRLIKRPGENRWQRQDRRWSEAALAEDAQGRILFVFCRAPLTMRDFNEAWPIPIVLGVQRR